MLNTPPGSRPGCRTGVPGIRLQPGSTVRRWPRQSVAARQDWTQARRSGGASARSPWIRRDPRSRSGFSRRRFRIGMVLQRESGRCGRRRPRVRNCGRPADIRARNGPRHGRKRKGHDLGDRAPTPEYQGVCPPVPSLGGGTDLRQKVPVSASGPRLRTLGDARSGRGIQRAACPFLMRRGAGRARTRNRQFHQRHNVINAKAELGSALVIEKQSGTKDCGFSCPPHRNQANRSAAGG